MQEQGGLVQEPLGRFHVLDDDGARHGMKLGVLLRGEFAAGEDNHGNVGQGRIVAAIARAARSPKCRAAGDPAPRNPLGSCAGPRARAAGAGGHDLDVGMTQQRLDRRAARRDCPRSPRAVSCAAGRRLSPWPRRLARLWPKSGLVTNEKAPLAKPCWRSSSRVMIWTGMWRVLGFCFNC